MHPWILRVSSGLVASIPSPSGGGFSIGPLRFRAYGLCIALGVVAAARVAGRRWASRGGRAADLSAVITWAVPAGVVGARLYHVATDWKSFRGRWFDVVKIWQGGLGVWGGVGLGVVVGLAVAHRRHLAFGPLLDVVAPAIPLAQAIGRIGNWFNIELFGRPSSLPWALEVPASKRPIRYASSPTFHPTFLYELLWDLLVVALVLVVERRSRTKARPLRAGSLFAVYAAGYTFGRFWIERLRIDAASKLLGLRINEWTSMVVFALAIACLIARRRERAPQTVANPAQ